MSDAYPSTHKGNAAVTDNDLLDFSKLTLVEETNSPMNSASLPQTLHQCVGYLEKLPLKLPNVDQKAPTKISNMVNILTNPDADALFTTEMQSSNEKQGRNEATPPDVFNPRESNIMMKELSRTKKNTCQARAPWIFGHVVNPGCISFYTKDGKTYAVTEGRWWLNSTKACWIRRNESLDKNVISPEESKVLIVRILPGTVGLARERGTEILLDVGTHVFNSGLVSFIESVNYKDVDSFSHGRYHYLRVARGNFGMVWVEVMQNGIKSFVPRLLKQGEHFIDSHLFKFNGFVKCNKEYIEHGSIHLISVPKGKIAKVFQENKPRLLGAGKHLIESTGFQFCGMVDIVNSNVIVHGTITILRVTLGKIALTWKDSDPFFIDKPGLYEFDSPDFSFVEFKDAEERLIQLGAKKIILVHTGQVGVTYDAGILKILKNGRHVISNSTHVFHRFLSTQQKSIRLATLNSFERNKRMTMQRQWSSKTQAKIEDQPRYHSDTERQDADLTICETKDLVKVGLRADVFYSIEDPEKCINKIDTDELEDLVRETAIATLTNIIRSTALNEIAQSKNISAGTNDGDLTILPPPDDSERPAPSAPMAIFFERAHDEFMEKLHDDFMQRYGVDIANIRIESFKIMDEDLSDQISKHALTTAQIENEMANLEGKSLISTQTERTAAEVREIAARAEVLALKTKEDAANQRKIDAANAEAESLRIKARAQAEAEAESILLRAEAEAKAIGLKAKAEAERAEVLSRTSLGKQEALLSVYSDMVVNSNKGVEKVVYLDPTVSRESPFALSSLHNLNQDLHSLTQLGIVAEEAGQKHEH